MDTVIHYLTAERVLLGIAAAVVILVVRAVTQRRRRPPGPPVWPVLGSLPYLGEDMGVFKKLAEKYGDIYYLELGLFGHNPTIVLNSIDLIREALLTKQDDFAGRNRTLIFDMFSENGKDIVMGDFNETWRYERKIAHTALRKYATGHQFQNLMERNVEMISEVFQKAGSEPVDILKLTSLVFYNVIATLCFGRNYSMDDPEFNRMRKMIDEASSIFTGFFLSDLHPMFQYIPTPTFPYLRKMKRNIIDFVSTFITEHKKTFDENDIRDFTDYILHSEQEMKRTGLDEYRVEITDVHIRLILVDMFFAGTDSSRIALTWALMFTAANPEFQRKAQKEIDDNIGRDGKITASNRNKIPYCEAILYETLRLRSPAPMAVPHATTCDTSVGGYEIPKGTQVMINLMRVHTDPRNFADPEKFNPERFLDEAGNLAPKPAAFLPFSTGRRQCVGEAFAKSELHVMFGMLLQRFTFSLPEGKKIDLTPKKNMFLYLPMDDHTQLVVKERLNQ